MANIAYVRVSTEEQNEARQTEALEKYSIDKWFKEKVSAKDTHRPELQRMIDYAREGDVIYIHDFSRLARNVKDLLTLIELFEAKGIKLVSNKEGLDTATPTGKLMLTVIGAINEFERNNLLDRQREGIAIAKRNGKYKGRNYKEVNNFTPLYEQYKQRKINKVKFAKLLGISRATLDKRLQFHENYLQFCEEKITKETFAELEKVDVKKLDKMLKRHKKMLASITDK